ncbi:unnamed protein product [Absidia cylindrospora]
MLFSVSIFFLLTYLTLPASGYLLAMVTTFPVILLVCRFRHLWFCHLLMVLAWLACVLTSGVFLDVENVAVWVVGGLVWLLVMTLGTQAKHYLAIHWHRLLWLPVSLVECVLLVCCRGVVWLTHVLVSLELAPLSGVWEDPLAELVTTMKELDCPDVFHVPPTIAEMQAWRDMRCDQEGQACRYQEGHMERMAIDTETYGPCRSMPCAVKEFDMVNLFKTLSID